MVVAIEVHDKKSEPQIPGVSLSPSFISWHADVREQTNAAYTRACEVKLAPFTFSKPPSRSSTSTPAVFFSIFFCIAPIAIYRN